MIPTKVSQRIGPSDAGTKGLDGRHLFPRAQQETVLGTKDMKGTNQVANFAPPDWKTSQIISDWPPAEYWPGMLQRQSGDSAWLPRQMYWDAPPNDWQNPECDEFLRGRRSLLAMAIRDGFNHIDAYSDASTADGPIVIDGEHEFGRL